MSNEIFSVLCNPKKSNNYLVTIAIGKDYFDKWVLNALPLWKKYCENNDIGIIAFHSDLLSKDSPVWKKATWQKLLIADILAQSDIEVNNVCYLDTDILINPYAPNIFQNYKEDTIGVVSLRNNVPYPLGETLRREAFLRHNHYSNDYPLDSALFISTENIYKYHGLEPQNDLFCAGLFLFNVENHRELMKQWFDKYPSNVDSITGGGDQTHLNYEFLKWGNISWLDYRFQAIWVYEMAWKYPFLYSYGKEKKDLIRECVESSLYANYFLHFAGSWYESDMWEVGDILSDKNKLNEMKDYYRYLEKEVTGSAKGVVKPSNGGKNDI